MRIVSVSENKNIEKRVAITPEIAKKYISLGIDVTLTENYGNHLGFTDDHYKNNGYDAIIMEWNNSFTNNSHWDNDLRYYPQFATHINNGLTIPLIWADSIAFQKFQAFIYNKINKNEYVNYLKSHLDNKDRFFPIYSNDVEIFDFRPGRFQLEPKISKYSEWVKICNLYKELAQKSWCEFIFPSKVLEGLKAKKAGNELILDSIQNPIVVKKQNKYNHI